MIFMYKAVIFDLDGTLLDSVDDIVYTLNQTLEQFSVAPVSREQTVSYIGNGASELVRLAIGLKNEGRLAEILACYKKAYAASDSSRTKVFEGEMQALLKMQAAGVKLAVLTNKPHAVAVKSIKQFFGGLNFDCVQGQQEGMPLKPATQGLLKILEDMGVSKRECLFVGDGEADVAVAQNAGVDCASVLWGYRTREQLEKIGAKIFVSSFGELLKIIL